MGPNANACAIPLRLAGRAEGGARRPGRHRISRLGISLGRVSRRCGTLALLALIGPASGLRAAASDPPLPPASGFRSLQLTTLDCGRENSSVPCDRARSMADPLLDHPRLSGRCKDVLWEIRQRATVAPTNSIQRREAINASARDLTVFCNPQIRKTEKPAASPPAASPSGGGFGFGSPPPR